ncbi:MAG TPA: biopolymer transporter ExbD [Polyangiales bacterium]|nr:biopolymer transporter ExbD [Polyangiales bacterium]
MAAQMNDGDELMTAINVTPLVDVTLVLLVILMITASYVASQSIPMNLPRGATGESTATTLTVSIDAQGNTFLDTAPIDATALRARFHDAHEANADTQAVIAADSTTDHGHVVRVIDLLRREQIVNFAINVQPEDVAP